MDLSPEYDAPVSVKLVSSAYKAAVADLSAKLVARDNARNNSTDAQLKESTLQAWIDAKKVVDDLGEKAFVSIDFPRLEWPQIKDIGKKLKAAGSVSIHSRAEETRIPQWERFRALQEHDSLGKSIPDIVRYSTTDDGIDDILSQQAPKAGLSPADAEQVWRAIGPLGKAALARELVSAANPERPTPPTSAPTRPNQ